MASDTRALDAQHGGRAVEVPEADERPHHAPASDRGRRRAVVVLLPLLLVAVAGILRFIDLDHPDRIYFDETYYAEDAREYLRDGVEEEFAVHPPVGKWLIAGGIAAFGYEPVGWRFAAAVAGTLTVLAAYIAGRRFFHHRGIAALGALLLAVDGIAFTMSRIAMLDAFLALFIVVGFWLLLVDRDRQWSGAPAGELDPGARLRADALPARTQIFRLLAGVAFGLALATKWSAVLAIGAAGLFLGVSELAWRRRLTGRYLIKPWRIFASGVLTLVAVPAVVYVLSYAPYFANFADSRPGERLCEEQNNCAPSLLAVVDGWWDEQVETLDFHRNLETEHQYRASALTWPTLYRPVAYYYESCTADRDVEEDGPCEVARGRYAEILGIANPAIWWPALAVGYPLLAFAAARRRGGRWAPDWRAWTLIVFLLAQWVPWLVLSRPIFFFYTTPITPFVCLTMAYVAWWCLRRPALRWVPAVIASLAVAGFLFWYPIFVGAELSEQAWRMRMLLRSWY